MVVRVIVKGVPGHIPIKDLRREFDIICNTNVLSDTFYVRELEASSSNGKRYIALDFQDAFDARIIQSNLDGRRCQLSSHVSFILRARIHPEASDRLGDIMELVSSSSSSVIPRELSNFVNVPSAEMIEDVVSSLKYKKKILIHQKEVLKAEREVLREKKKLARDYKTRIFSDSDEEIPERANRRRRRKRSPSVFYENEKARKASKYRRRSNSKQRPSYKYVCPSSLSTESRSNSPKAYRGAEMKPLVPKSRRLRSPEGSWHSPKCYKSRSPSDKPRSRKEKSLSPKERSSSPKRQSLLPNDISQVKPSAQSAKISPRSPKDKSHISKERSLSPKKHELKSAKRSPRSIKLFWASKEKSQSPKHELESKLRPRSPKEQTRVSQDRSLSPKEHNILETAKQRPSSLKEEYRASKEISQSPRDDKLESAKINPYSLIDKSHISKERLLSPKKHELESVKHRPRSIKEVSRSSKERSQSPKHELESKLRPRSPEKQTRASQDRSLPPKVYELQFAKERPRLLKGAHSSKERSYSPEKRYRWPKSTDSLRKPRERSWSPRKRSHSPKENLKYHRQHSPENHSLGTSEYFRLTPKEYYRSRKEQNYFAPPHRQDNYRPKSPSFYRDDSYKHYERTSYSKRSIEETYRRQSPHYDCFDNLKRPKEELYKSRCDYYKSPSKTPKDEYYSKSYISHKYNTHEEQFLHFPKTKHAETKTEKKTRYVSSEEDESSNLLSTSISIRELKSPEIPLADFGKVKSRKVQKNKSSDAKRLKSLSIAVEQVLLECKLILRKEMALNFGLPLSREGKEFMVTITGLVEDIAKKRFNELKISWWNGKSAEELAAYYRKQHSTEDDEKLIKKLISELKETKFVDKVEDGELIDEQTVEPTLKTEQLWNAVDEVLLNLKIDEFRVGSTQQDETDDDTTILPADTAPKKPVPTDAMSENPQFTTPLKVLLRQMIKFIKNKEEECKYLYNITRSVIKDRLVEVMKGKDITRNCLIIKAYREVYNKSGDEEFIKKIVEDIGEGKYELLTTQLELKTTLPPRDINVP